MKAVIQRVTDAKVVIDEGIFSEIKKGLLVLIAVSKEDQEEDAKYLAEKCVGLRIFEDEHGKMNLDAKQTGGELLIVPNFTLYGDCAHGKRPNFMAAESSTRAIPLYEEFLYQCRILGAIVKTGKFGADMKVSFTNDGPVTILLDTKELRTK